MASNCWSVPPRKVALTLAGAHYYERVGDIAAQLALADEEVRRQQDTLSGRLRVSAPLSLGLRILPAAIVQFRLLYPKVDLDLELSDDFVDIVAGQFDMALRISGMPSDKSTIWRKIAPVSRALVASPTYLQRMGVPDTPSDLTRHDCLGYAYLAGGTVWHLTHVASGETRPVSLTFCFCCNNGDLLSALAVESEGIAMLPHFIVATEIAAGRLVEILADWTPPPIWLTAFYPPYERLPVKVQTFTSFIEGSVDTAILA